VKGNGRLHFAAFTYIDERENAQFCMFGSAKASLDAPFIAASCNDWVPQRAG